MARLLAALPAAVLQAVGVLQEVVAEGAAAEEAAGEAAVEPLRLPQVPWRGLLTGIPTSAAFGNFPSLPQQASSRLRPLLAAAAVAAHRVAADVADVAAVVLQVVELPAVTALLRQQAVLVAVDGLLRGRVGRAVLLRAVVEPVVAGGGISSSILPTARFPIRPRREPRLRTLLRTTWPMNRN
jgi:hypothetical protein